MQNYRASNRVPFASFILLLLVGVIVAVGAGMLLWAAENVLNIYLIVAFPIIAAAIVGGALALVVRSGKVRSPFVAALFGLLAGALMYATYHFATYYITFRGTMREAYIENSGRTPTDEQLDRELNELMEDEVGASGFLGYLQIAAQEGFSITRSFSSSSSGSGIELQGTGVWVYWGAELLVIVLITVLMARRPATEPFDEDDNVWYGAPQLVGIASSKARKPLIEALENGDFQGAGTMLTMESLKHPRTELMIRRSPVENGLPQDIYVSVNQTQRNGRGTAAKTGIISPTEFDWIMRAMRGDTASGRAPSSSASTPSQRFEF